MRRITSNIGNKNSSGNKVTYSTALATTIGTVNDMLVGKKTGTSEQMAAPTGLTRALDSGTGFSFAKQ